MTSPRVWSPWRSCQSSGHVLVLLNQPILDEQLFISLWNRALYRATVDGGTSIWHRLINNTHLSIVKEAPDMITGDFDSADMENVRYFQSLGSRIIATVDQDRTDFTKCLAEIGKCLASNELEGSESILAYVENSGRLDQIMANIQTLFLAKDIVDDLPLYLVSSQSVSFLLEPGTHIIRLDSADMSGAHCGLIPIAGKARVTTSGLKWNLKDEDLQFGQLVSTSNAFDPLSSEIRISTDTAILWTMDIMEHANRTL